MRIDTATQFARAYPLPTGKGQGEGESIGDTVITLSPIPAPVKGEGMNCCRFTHKYR